MLWHGKQFPMPVFVFWQANQQKRKGENILHKMGIMDQMYQNYQRRNIN